MARIIVIYETAHVTVIRSTKIASPVFRGGRRRDDVRGRFLLEVHAGVTKQDPRVPDVLIRDALLGGPDCVADRRVRPIE